MGSAGCYKVVIPFLYSFIKLFFNLSLVLENMGSADCYKVAHVVDTGVILYSINGQFRKRSILE